MLFERRLLQPGDGISKSRNVFLDRSFLKVPIFAAGSFLHNAGFCAVLCCVLLVLLLFLNPVLVLHEMQGLRLFLLLALLNFFQQRARFFSSGQRLPPAEATAERTRGRSNGQSRARSATSAED